MDCRCNDWYGKVVSVSAGLEEKISKMTDDEIALAADLLAGSLYHSQEAVIIEHLMRMKKTHLSVHES